MKMPFDPDSADEKIKMIAESCLLKVKNPANRRSVSDARKDLEKHVLECLERENTDFETIYALSDALKVFTRKTKPKFRIFRSRCTLYGSRKKCNFIFADSDIYR